MPSASLHPVALASRRGIRRHGLTAIAVGVVAALLGAGAMFAWRHAYGGDEIPVLGALPAFALLDERGEPFGSADLRGKVWVANFIFTRCPTVCPLFTRKMASLQPLARELGGGLHLVSFSVDPEFDRPEVLRAYAEKAGADPERWTFLTGEAAQIRATVLNGFKVTLGRSAEDATSILHGTHFVLVDGDGRVRGYYASGDPAAVERLRRDMARLARTDAAR